MSSFEIVDTFPAFLDYWAGAQGKPLEEQIARWASEYMSGWEELLEKQIRDYSEQNLDWREIAREKIFPDLNERIPAMQEARANLLALGPTIFSRGEQVLGFKLSTYFVIYVGLGCGAGWVTPFRDRQSILFGLENIAESGWSDADSITGLVAHELGHVAHFFLRAQHKLQSGSGPWWQLYTEGFAQHCEALVADSSHHQAPASDWLPWCQDNKGRLAAEFLQAADAGQPVNVFFGSWLEIDGHSETGYFLGQEIIQALAKKMSFREIALLEDFETYPRDILEEMKQKD